MADPLKFRAAAERLYRAEGASAQEARDLAEAWFARIREDDLGFRSDGNDFVQLAGAGTGTKFEKSRTFGKNAEKILADFYFQNPADILPARSEEHTSELQSLMRISYAVFCLKKKNN